MIFSGFELAVVWAGTYALHQAALNPLFFVLQQLAFLTAGIVVWMPGLVRRNRGAIDAGILAAGLSFTHMTMLRVLLTLAGDCSIPRGSAAAASASTRSPTSGWAGFIMAVFDGLPYLVGTVVFAHRFLGGGPAPDTGGGVA